MAEDLNPLKIYEMCCQVFTEAACYLFFCSVCVWMKHNQAPSGGDQVTDQVTAEHQVSLLQLNFVAAATLQLIRFELFLRSERLWKTLNCLYVLKIFRSVWSCLCLLLLYFIVFAEGMQFYRLR